jgi:hypothetical protein
VHYAGKLLGLKSSDNKTQPDWDALTRDHCWTLENEEKISELFAFTEDGHSHKIAYEKIKCMELKLMESDKTVNDEIFQYKNMKPVQDGLIRMLTHPTFYEWLLKMQKMAQYMNNEKYTTGMPVVPSTVPICQPHCDDDKNVKIDQPETETIQSTNTQLYSDVDDKKVEINPTETETKTETIPSTNTQLDSEVDDKMLTETETTQSTNKQPDSEVDGKMVEINPIETETIQLRNTQLVSDLTSSLFFTSGTEIVNLV